MPSKVYRHPGGMREERAHLLSSSDGPDYNSGTEATGGSLRAARSASLDLVAVAEMNGNGQEQEAVVDVHNNRHDGPFTDLTEDEALLNQKS